MRKTTWCGSTEARRERFINVSLVLIFCQISVGMKHFKRMFTDKFQTAITLDSAVAEGNRSPTQISVSTSQLCSQIHFASANQSGPVGRP